MCSLVSMSVAQEEAKYSLVAAAYLQIRLSWSPRKNAEKKNIVKLPKKRPM